MITKEEWKTLQGVRREAYFSGIGVFTRLDEIGMLLTQAKRSEIAAEGLNVVSRGLGTQNPAGILHEYYGDTLPRTNAELWIAIEWWLQKRISETLKILEDNRAGD
jgi:hypothetical protein